MTPLFAITLAGACIVGCEAVVRSTYWLSERGHLGPAMKRRALALQQARREPSRHD